MKGGEVARGIYRVVCWSRMDYTRVGGKEGGRGRKGEYSGGSESLVPSIYNAREPVDNG